MREKLIELIASKVCDTYSEACEEWIPHDCGKCYANNCHIAEIADHLIANGVRLEQKQAASKTSEQFASDNHVGGKWISVEDRLPNICEPVLVCCDFMGGKAFRVSDRYGKNGMLWAGIPESHKVTHWMPLPEPPKGEQ